GCLRGSRRAPAGQAGIVVAAAGLAPAAACLLHLLEPGDCLAHHRLLHVEANAAQAAQYLPGAVNVIDPPAADPGAVPLLSRLQEAQGAGDLSLPGGKAVMPERFEDPGRDVRAARVEHGIVI